MKITRAVVPSLFTVLNMFCGFMSIVASVEGTYRVAAGFIILGAIFDGLDGVMARITKSSSAFGVQFDSLSDVVTFGAAPSLLVYQLHLHTMGGLGMLISAMLMVMGGIRLARFNVQLVGFDKEYFTGLPIPAQAVTISGFVWLFSKGAGELPGLAADLLAPLIVILALLMVSRVRYDTLPTPSKRAIKEHPIRFALFTLGAVVILATKGEALFPVLLLFVASGLIRWLIKTIHNLTHPTSEREEEEAEVSSLDV